MSTTKDNSDHLTHPQMYRQSINHSQSSITKNQSKKEQIIFDWNKMNQQQEQGQQDLWDLYPQLIRDIENKGTREQVKHLHDLENSPSKQR
ncbi:uncharacterized protein BX664DRAFT_341073 [Halteromyces radiatus]|uniref:uncharacterized protein n=1 Tax=Halteromyces radiatus TaxID=101107 RepID=UPI00221E56EF|nr:uncharacterized protein BX664DRAFT_341073 [Halteromyces radiatus]KAI8081706.1 hypothetical protein BX664DRAFT_341073 [Halteromyces radiatus]